MATRAQRDARLDVLLKATQEWATKRTKELQSQVSMGRAILKGRTGAERMAQETVQAATDLTVDELNDFLTGDA